MRAHAALIALAGLLAAPAWADECTGLKWPITHEAAAFAAPGLTTVSSGQAGLGIDTAAALKLLPQGEVTFPQPPKRAPRSNPAYGGVFATGLVPAAGRYTVTLSSLAWIDLIQDGKVLRPEAFTDARGCATVRKSLRFDLAAGPLTVEISDAPRDTLDLMVTPTAAP